MLCAGTARRNGAPLQRGHAMKRLGLGRAIAVVVAIALGGCTNLDAVKDFANAAGGIAQYDALVVDYVAFPARQKRC